MSQINIPLPNGILPRWWLVILVMCFFLPPNIWSNAPPKTNMTMEHHHFLNRRYEIRLQVVCFPASHISFLRCTSQFWIGHICSIVFFSQNASNSWKVQGHLPTKPPFSLPRNGCQCYLVAARCRFLYFFFNENKFGIQSPQASLTPKISNIHHTSLYRVDVSNF